MDVLGDKDLENITVEEAEKMGGEKFSRAYGHDLYDAGERELRRLKKTYKVEIEDEE